MTVGEFQARRGKFFGLAYRLPGSAEEAEGTVQDAFLRWDRADRAAIAHPDAWLAKVVTNLCLTRLTAARATRETYLGPRLPEPVLTDALGPLETAEQRDSVSLALLVLLERLTPVERAVFVLREAFGYPHREIARSWRCPRRTAANSSGAPPSTCPTAGNASNRRRRSVSGSLGGSCEPRGRVTCGRWRTC